MPSGAPGDAPAASAINAARTSWMTIYRTTSRAPRRSLIRKDSRRGRGGCRSARINLCPTSHTAHGGEERWLRSQPMRSKSDPILWWLSDCDAVWHIDCEIETRINFAFNSTASVKPVCISCNFSRIKFYKLIYVIDLIRLHIRYH